MSLLTDIENVYFLGIGGIGMSALARYFKAYGKRVYGYDRTATPLTDTLESEGMLIHYTDDPQLISPACRQARLRRARLSPPGSRASCASR